MEKIHLVMLIFLGIIVLAGIIYIFENRRNPGFPDYKTPPIPPPPYLKPEDWKDSEDIHILLRVLLQHYQEAAIKVSIYREGYEVDPVGREHINLTIREFIDNHYPILSLGLCYAVEHLLLDDVLNWEQGDLLVNYFISNKPISKQTYQLWWPEKETAPRIKWLRKHIEITKK